MIDLLYRSPLFNILILETWTYVALGLRLSLANFSALTAVLVVLIYPSLKNILTEVLLALICPVLFYVNAGHDWLQVVPVVYFVLFIAILKFAPTTETQEISDIDILEFDEQPYQMAPQIAYADQTLTLSQRPRSAPGPQVLSFGPRPGMNATTNASETQMEVPPPESPQRKPLEWTVAPFAIIGIGFALGWFWNPAPRTSLSLEPDVQKPYFSYIQPARTFLENKTALLKERELNTYLEPKTTTRSPIFKFLTFSPSLYSLPRLPSIPAPPQLVRMYDQVSKIIPRSL